MNAAFNGGEWIHFRHTAALELGEGHNQAQRLDQPRVEQQHLMKAVCGRGRGRGVRRDNERVGVRGSERGRKSEKTGVRGRERGK